MLKKKKMYLVRYEVIATSVKQALTTRGVVCDEKFWPNPKKKFGFKEKK